MEKPQCASALTEEQIAALVRPVPGTDEEAVYVEDLQAQADSVDSLTDVASPPHYEEEPADASADEGLASPSQDAAVVEALQRHLEPRDLESPVSQVIMDMHPQQILSNTRSRKPSNTYTPDLIPQHATGALTPMPADSGLHKMHSRSSHSVGSHAQSHKLRQLSGGVASLPHVPGWMMNPALGGFNPLPPKQALRASVCTKYIMRRDEPENFTEALVRQAEQMISNEKNFYRRGSVSGWKIKPVTASKSAAAASRVGGIRPRSSALPQAGAGFFFDESRAITPNTTQHLANAGAQVSTMDTLGMPSARRGRGEREPGRPSSLPANGLLPEPSYTWYPGIGKPQELMGSTDAGGASGHNGLRGKHSHSTSHATHSLSRPSRQRRKLPLEGLTPSGRSDLAARPPAWLEPMHARASLRNLEEAPPRISTLGADLYLKHVRETQRQLDEMLVQRPEELQGRVGPSRASRREGERFFSSAVRPEQSARTGLLR